MKNYVTGQTYSWNLMLLNARCCRDNNYRYTMLDNTDNYTGLSVAMEEKDLGVIFESNLKFEKHSYI